MGKKAKIKPKKYYAVKNGRECGVIVETWAECKELTDHFPNPVFKSFLTEEEAKEFLKVGYTKKTKVDDVTVADKKESENKKPKRSGKTIEVTIRNIETYNKFVEVCKQQDVGINLQIERLMKELTDLY